MKQVFFLLSVVLLINVVNPQELSYNGSQTDVIQPVVFPANEMNSASNIINNNVDCYINWIYFYNNDIEKNSTANDTLKDDSENYY